MATPTSTVATPSKTAASAFASCTTAIPDKYGHVPIDACNSYYNFDPKFEPALAVAVLFGLFMVAHLVLAFIYKKVRLPHPIIPLPTKLNGTKLT